MSSSSSVTPDSLHIITSRRRPLRRMANPNLTRSLAHSLMNRVANLRAARGDLSGSERARRIAEKLEGGLGLWGGMWSVEWEWDYVRNYAWRDMSSIEKFRAAYSDMNEIFRALNELTRMKSNKERAAWILENCQIVFTIWKSISSKLGHERAGSYMNDQMFSDMYELFRSLNELTSMKSNKERATWVLQNYQIVLKIWKSFSNKLGVGHERAGSEMKDQMFSDNYEPFRAVKELTSMKSNKERVAWVLQNYRSFNRSGSLRELVLTLQKEAEGDLLRDCLELLTNDLKGLIQVVKDIALQFSTSGGDRHCEPADL